MRKLAVKETSHNVLDNSIFSNTRIFILIKKIRTKTLVNSPIKSALCKVLLVLNILLEADMRLYD